MFIENQRNWKRKRSCQRKRNRRKEKPVQGALKAAVVTVVKVTVILVVLVQKKKERKKKDIIKLRKNQNQALVRKVNTNQKSEMKKKIINTNCIPVQVNQEIEKEDQVNQVMTRDTDIEMKSDEGDKLISDLFLDLYQFKLNT